MLKDWHCPQCIHHGQRSVSRVHGSYCQDCDGARVNTTHADEQSSRGVSGRLWPTTKREVCWVCCCSQSSKTLTRNNYGFVLCRYEASTTLSRRCSLGSVVKCCENSRKTGRNTRKTAVFDHFGCCPAGLPALYLGPTRHLFRMFLASGVRRLSGWPQRLQD